MCVNFHVASVGGLVGQKMMSTRSPVDVALVQLARVRLTGALCGEVWYSD